MDLSLTSRSLVDVLCLADAPPGTPDLVLLYRTRLESICGVRLFSGGKTESDQFAEARRSSQMGPGATGGVLGRDFARNLVGVAGSRP